MSFSRGKAAMVLAFGLLTVVAALAFSCALGAQRISLLRAFSGEEPDHAILFGLRLPRALLGALVGCALASAGTALQALLRNPLAEPFVLGVSGGAALGGAIVMLAANLTEHLASQLGLFIGAAHSVAFGAVAGATGATLLVFTLGRVGGRLVPEAALLAGVIFNAFAAGIITLLKVLVSPVQGARLLRWLTGTLGYESGTTLTVSTIWIITSVGMLLFLSARLNLLTLGDLEAASLGVHVGRTRAAVLLAASAATGAAVALSGMVGFVGLVIPHAARHVLGPDHRLLVLASALFGAAFLIIADALARIAFISLGTEPPVGALTALVGGPLFLWLLRRAGHADRD